ncbi:SH3 domain-containing kinase-binding protein 1 isoform 2-T4 [Menidia menidia]
MGSYSSAIIPDTEEFDSIVSVEVSLAEQVTIMMEEERTENESNPSTKEESTTGTNQNSSGLQDEQSKSVPVQSFSSLLPKALSAVLHPAVPSDFSSEARPNRNPDKNTKPSLEHLQTELRDLRDQLEQMKSQHNKEIKLLMNELDEEKRIRLTLQMEIQRMKKHMLK